MNPTDKPEQPTPAPGSSGSETPEPTPEAQAEATPQTAAEATEQPTPAPVAPAETAPATPTGGPVVTPAPAAEAPAEQAPPAAETDINAEVEAALGDQSIEQLMDAAEAEEKAKAALKAKLDAENAVLAQRADNNKLEQQRARDQARMVAILGVCQCRVDGVGCALR